MSSLSSTMSTSASWSCGKWTSCSEGEGFPVLSRCSTLSIVTDAEELMVHGSCSGDSKTNALNEEGVNGFRSPYQWQNLPDLPFRWQILPTPGSGRPDQTR